MRITLFGKSRAIEAEIDEFLDNLSDSGMLFEQLVKHYVTHGPDDSFSSKVVRLNGLEHAANEIASRIGRSLYTEMLIPDLRADVLSLIQDLDYLIDVYSKIASAFEIERPDHSIAPEDSQGLYLELLENTVACVEAAVKSARAFFKNIAAVEDNVHKIGFYEGEVDDLAVRLKKVIFDSDLGLDQKMHFRYFVDALDELSDDAEDVGEWISIYAIKRSL
ncbi:MAG TPA: DUF47 family protein [Sedimenticola sp.]|nr:DUF47 family protein [Sedimenticola sp.]